MEQIVVTSLTSLKVQWSRFNIRVLSS
ncbi:hypothetical protein F383_31540 [Gossypium arboreum]|uniref:Uncharacterized protein n=1 Tax=Gossypium arboreum TaxID=29729 RepID=A0A0B0MXT0_GOSAR|nr:hypothetical protein F383_31540 [Gossypium arboreum]